MSINQALFPQSDGNTDGLIKGRFPVQPESSRSADESDYEWERFWIAPIGDGQYEVRNTPFLAYGLNWGDVVTGTFDDVGILVIERIERRGGHRTLRIAFAREKTTSEKESVLLELQHLGATHENMNGRIFSIDVPPEASYESVVAHLMEAERSGRLEFEVGSDGT
jgi:hypothetical protein